MAHHADPITDCRPLIALAQALYRLDRHGVGGCLHIVLDDANVEDDHVQFCLDYARTGQCRTDGTPCAAGIALATLLLRCTKTQRRKVAGAVYDDPDDPDPSPSVP